MLPSPQARITAAPGGAARRLVPEPRRASLPAGTPRPG